MVIFILAATASQCIESKTNSDLIDAVYFNPSHQFEWLSEWKPVLILSRKWESLYSAQFPKSSGIEWWTMAHLICFENLCQKENVKQNIILVAY